jgi:hypothetical protein
LALWAEHDPEKLQTFPDEIMRHKTKALLASARFNEVMAHAKDKAHR